MDNKVIHIVTGAPGAGKSTALQSLVSLSTDYLAFDMDWLIGSASRLAGKDLHFEPSVWRPYNQLWFDVLHSVYLNNRVPVLFAPIAPNDIPKEDMPNWCVGINWLLLDCADDVRKERLMARSDWSQSRVDEAFEDASELRSLVQEKLDTGVRSPQMVAEGILEWLNRA